MVQARVMVAAGIAGLAATGALALGSPGAAAAGSAGALDPAFGSSGTVQASVGPGPEPTGIVVQPNGDIVVGLGLDAQFAVARFLPGGALDKTFGTDGVASGPDVVPGSGQAGPTEMPTSIAVEPGGAIVEAGVGQLANGQFGFGLARFNANGTLDTTFGQDGGVAVAVPVDSGGADTVLPEPGGKILVGGTEDVKSGAGRGGHGVLMRFDANGTLDTSFGDGGIVVLSSNVPEINALAIDDNGDIFVPAPAEEGNLNDTGGTTEISPTGTVDATVTPATVVSSSTGYTPPDAVAFLPTGASVLATNVGTVKHSFEAEAQGFTATGQPTPGFQITPFRYDGSTAATGQDAANAVAVTPAGQIIIAGYENTTPTSFGVERLNASGTRDTTFGTGGGVTTSFPGGGQAQAVAVTPGGDIIAAGEDLSTSELLLAEYLG
jgi:uncharacterized delta-60 repeat protein